PMEAATLELQKAIATQSDKKALLKEMSNLEDAANKWLKPYPNAGLRENIEVLLVAIAVAMAIRTFFLQPFKIPTGSMQPTLYGVTSVPDFSRGGIESETSPPNFEIPTGWARAREWFAGVSYLHIKAKVDGELENVSAPFR